MSGKLQKRESKENNREHFVHLWPQHLVIGLEREGQVQSNRTNWNRFKSALTDRIKRTFTPFKMKIEAGAHLDNFMFIPAAQMASYI